MEFVILFASQGRYLSRNLHQVMKNIIARAMEAVQANNIDPYRYIFIHEMIKCSKSCLNLTPFALNEHFQLCSVLPEDEWFADVAQIAIKMLLGQANFDNNDRDNNSPTASISSVHSHGSQ